MTPRRYRVYFNARADWPRVWSIDAGTQESEIIVKLFTIDNCRAVARTLTGAELAEADRTRTPIAWLEVDGILDVRDDVAMFHRW